MNKLPLIAPPLVYGALCNYCFAECEMEAISMVYVQKQRQQLNTKKMCEHLKQTHPRSYAVATKFIVSFIAYPHSYETLAKFVVLQKISCFMEGLQAGVVCRV